MRKEDVKVLFNAGVLTIKGERKVEKEVKGETVHRTERFFGTFERSFELPDDVDPKAIHAECKDGVLLVSLPRIAVEKPRPLAITIRDHREGGIAGAPVSGLEGGSIGSGRVVVGPRPGRPRSVPATRPAV